MAIDFSNETRNITGSETATTCPAHPAHPPDSTCATGNGLVWHARGECGMPVENMRERPMSGKADM